MFGFLNVFKPRGSTSYAVVAYLHRRLRRDLRIGHAGTLDPFAEGVLVISLGQATRLTDRLQARPKRYVARVMLGATSDTDDPEGPTAATPGAAAPPLQAVRDVLVRFVGEIQQTPPAHSAVRVAGRRAYRIARSGRAPEIAPRPVTIYAIDLLRYEYPLLELDVQCGSGTYLRSLARDIGAALGVGGYCDALRRTRVGPFDLADALPPDAIDPRRHLASPLIVLDDMPHVRLIAADAALVARGHAVNITAQLGTNDLGDGAAAPHTGDVALLDADGELLAVAHCDSAGLAKPDKVFCETPGAKRMIARKPDLRPCD